MSQEQDVNAQPLVCYNHPDRETMLRCNRCTSCAVLTPTGYRCKECVRGQQKIFDTAQWYDYPLAFVVAGVLSFLGSFAASFLGFFTLFIAPVVGVILAEAVRWVVGRRRSKRLYQVAIAGALPLLLMGLIPLFFGSGIGSLLSLLWPGAYVFLVISTAYYRLSGIQIR
jgi:hypothetical protein